MTAAVPLSFGAAVAAVLGAWELLAVAERTRLAAAVGRIVEPVARAGREGREPSRPERRAAGRARPRPRSRRPAGWSAGLRWRSSRA